MTTDTRSFFLLRAASARAFRVGHWWADDTFRWLEGSAYRDGWIPSFDQTANGRTLY